MAQVRHSTDFERQSVGHNVKQREDGCFCGLIVKEEFAMRFIEEDENKRKTMEIRHRKFSFVKEGERILLVSSRPGRPRNILAILEFVSCLEIAEGDFSQYESMHRVTGSEFESYKSLKATSHEGNHSVFGYQFRLIHQFALPPILPSYRGEVWLWISPAAVADGKLLAGAFSSPSSVPATESVKCTSSQVSRIRKQLTWTSESQTELTTDSTNGHEGSMNYEETLVPDNLETGQDDEVTQDDEFTCALLYEPEWDALVKGITHCVLRPFSSNATKLLVLVRRPEGHFLKGQVKLTECKSEWTAKQGANKIKLGKEWQQVYTKTQIEEKLKLKNGWVWVFEDIQVYPDSSRPVPFLDCGAKFKNRTFRLTKAQLNPVDETVPKERNFYETARSLIAKLDQEKSRLFYSAGFVL